MFITYYQMDIVTKDGQVFIHTFEPTVKNPSMDAISVLEHEYYADPLKVVYFREIHRNIEEET